MALVGLPGSKRAFIGPNAVRYSYWAPIGGAATLDAANEAVIMIGHIETSDGGSHTIDTTGSSSICLAHRQQSPLRMSARRSKSALRRLIPRPGRQAVQSMSPMSSRSMFRRR